MIGSQKNNKNAYILFKEETSVKEAEKLNGYGVHNSDFTQTFHLRVDSDVKKDNDFSHSIFIGNLPFIVNEEDIRMQFERLGKIVNIRVVRDNKTCMGTGIAFIQYSTEEEVINAVEKCTTEKRFMKFKGRDLRVKKAVPNQRKGDKFVQKKDNRRRNKREEKESRKFQENFVKSSVDKRNGNSPNIYNDVKLKKHKRVRMMNEMINEGGRSKIRERNRKYVTNKIDYQVRFHVK